MSVIKIIKISEKEIKSFRIKREIIRTFINNNLIPVETDNIDEFTINTVKSTLLGKIFGRNIFGKKFNLKFIEKFRKLTPALTIIIIGDKMSIDVYDKEVKDLITEIIVPIFDDVQGLTIEFRQYFVDSEE